jgi:hypothetical protein
MLSQRIKSKWCEWYNIKTMRLKLANSILIIILILLACNEIILTDAPHPPPQQPTGSEMWRLLDVFVMPYYGYSLAAKNYDDIWISGLSTDFTATAFAARRTEGIWHYFYYTDNHDCWFPHIECQPYTENVWMTIEDTDSTADSGIYRYDVSQPGFPFVQVVTCPSPSIIDFLDADNGAVVTRTLNNSESGLWIYDHSAWTLHHINIDAMYGYTTDISMAAPGVVYIISYEEEVIIRWNNDTYTSIYFEKPRDIYMINDSNGFLVTDRGLFRKTNGSDWYGDPAFPGDAAFSVDGSSGQVWIFGAKDSIPCVWKFSNGTYSAEEVAPIISGGQIKVVDSPNPNSGFLWDDTSILARYE